MKIWIEVAQIDGNSSFDSSIHYHEPKECTETERVFKSCQCPDCGMTHEGYGEDTFFSHWSSDGEFDLHICDDFGKMLALEILKLNLEEPILKKGSLIKLDVKVKGIYDPLNKRKFEEE